MTKRLNVSFTFLFLILFVGASCGAQKAKDNPSYDISTLPCANCEAGTGALKVGLWGAPYFDRVTLTIDSSPAYVRTFNVVLGSFANEQFLNIPEGTNLTITLEGKPAEGQADENMATAKATISNISITAGQVTYVSGVVLAQVWGVVSLKAFFPGNDIDVPAVDYVTVTFSGARVDETRLFYLTAPSGNPAESDSQDGGENKLQVPVGYPRNLTVKAYSASGDLLHMGALTNFTVYEGTDNRNEWTLSITNQTGKGGIDLSGNSCLPNCGGKECGSDGCLGKCGGCPPEENCDAGACRGMFLNRILSGFYYLRGSYVMDADGHMGDIAGTITSNGRGEVTSAEFTLYKGGGVSEAITVSSGTYAVDLSRFVDITLETSAGPIEIHGRLAADGKKGSAAMFGSSFGTSQALLYKPLPSPTNADAHGKAAVALLSTQYGLLQGFMDGDGNGRFEGQILVQVSNSYWPIMVNNTSSYSVQSSGVITSNLYCSIFGTTELSFGFVGYLGDGVISSAMYSELDINSPTAVPVGLGMGAIPATTHVIADYPAEKVGIVIFLNTVLESQVIGVAYGSMNDDGAGNLNGGFMRFYSFSQPSVAIPITIQDFSYTLVDNDGTTDTITSMVRASTTMTFQSATEFSKVVDLRMSSSQTKDFFLGSVTGTDLTGIVVMMR